MLQLVRRYGFYSQPPETAWPDDATLAAAMSLYGGWKALCAKLPGEGPELLGAAKLFKASYVAFDGRVRRGELLPAGRESEQIEARGTLTSLKDALTKRGLPTGAL